ncbi:MAG: hypothetical protein VX436_00360 [Planctomycetota bacterium]|nr:hypothetical protein [Planctomycetota bacterium]
MHIAGSITFEEAQAYAALKASHLVRSKPIARTEQLIAAHVPGEVEFDGVAVSTMQPLQLYTRCADRIEVATLLATGQNLDIQA